MRFLKSLKRYTRYLAVILLIIVVSETLIIGLILKQEHTINLTEGGFISQTRQDNSVAAVQNWADAIQSTTRSGGVRVAFELFDKLFNTEPNFAENCHSYTHIIGEEAYKNFGTGENLDLTPQIAYCSYGFFHGFMETMLHFEGNLQNARNFCLNVDKKLGEDLYTLGPCFHGIGHGVADSTNKTIRGQEDVFALVFEGLRLCEDVGQTKREIKLCGTGVFNALAIMYLNPEQYGLAFNPQDPYQFCREQKVSSYFREACYEDFKIIPMSLESNNFEKAARYVEEIKEDQYAVAAMDTVASFTTYYLLRDIKDRENAIKSCYSLQERLWASCIAGLGAGFLGQATPEKEYVMALEVCNSSLVQEKERVACYERVGRLINLRYPKQKAHAICNTVEEKYRRYCE